MFEDDLCVLSEVEDEEACMKGVEGELRDRAWALGSIIVKEACMRGVEEVIFCGGMVKRCA